MQTFLMTLCIFCIGVFSVFGAHRLMLLAIFLQKRKEDAIQPQGFFEDLPRVTVQLPLYNERYVAKRLIHAVSRIDYPRDRLEIQVLDDSTDVTRAQVDGLVRLLQAQGLNIKTLHREERVGFKAGALQYGLERCEGEFVLIFDADFIPEPDVLKKSIHYFTHERTGMVQFRWDHVNRSYSLLTRIQAILLDGHFMIEHFARNRSGRFFNFNGTAGIWRKSCIIDAGGWQGDTLTEDMDLSYRAQMKGWSFLFVPDIRVPAELPVELAAFKSQQYRWAKGAIQTAMKILPGLYRSSVSPSIKIEATFHMLANVMYLFLPCLILMLPFLIACFAPAAKMMYGFLLITSFVSIILFYMTAQLERLKGNIWRCLGYVPILMAVGIGLCVNNSRAVLDALFQRRSEFVRTPKYNVITAKDTWCDNVYRVRMDVLTLVEVFFMAYLLWVTVVAFQQGAYYILPFISIFLFGFVYFPFLTLRQGRYL